MTLKTPFALCSPICHAETALAAYLAAEADGFTQSPETYWLAAETGIEADMAAQDLAIEARYKRHLAAKKAAATRKRNAKAKADGVLADSYNVAIENLNSIAEIRATEALRAKRSAAAAKGAATRKANRLKATALAAAIHSTSPNRLTAH